MCVEFDRGTLLVRGDVAEAGAGLPGLAWDPRVREWRAPAFRHAEIVAVLRARGVRVSDAAVGRIEVFPWRTPALHEHQREALAAWRAANERGVVALPTGAGKTRVALAAAASLGVPTLVLVPTRVLLEQWRRASTPFYPGPIGLWGDGDHHLAGLTIATYEGAWRAMEHAGRLFGLLVVDEAHHFAGGARGEALEMCLAKRRLGLTATPPAGEGLARLAELVGPVVHERTIAQMTGRALARFDTFERRVRLEPDERAIYAHEQAIFRDFAARFRRVSPDAAWADLAAEAARSAEGRRAMLAFRRARAVLSLPRAKLAAVREILAAHPDSRALLFTADNAAAYRLSRTLLVPAITCAIGRDERASFLALFRAGRCRALVSSRVLNEGLDVPDADLAIIVGGTLGGGEHVQRVGRVLRPRPGKRALVYDLVVDGTVERGQARRRQLRLGLGDAAGA